MRSRTLHIIICSLIVFTGSSNAFSQGTTFNIIANYSFEYHNTSSTFYREHASDMTDSSFLQTPVSCWINAGRSSAGVSVYDTTLAYSNLQQPIGNGFLPYPQHLLHSLWLESFFNTTNNIARTASAQTKLSSPLQGGIQYKLSGYVNASPYVGENLPLYDTTAYRVTHTKQIGFYFTSNKIYNPSSSVIATNIFLQNPPTVSYTFIPFERDFINPWQYFELTFTASGNENYLSVSHPDTALYYYSEADSMMTILGKTYGTGAYSEIFLDNLILIPLSDTGKTVINRHIPDPDSLFLETNILACNVASISLQSGADFWSYQWSTGDTTPQVNVSADGTYYVTVSNGCGLYADSVVVRFAVTDTISLLLSADKTDLCNDSATIMASSGFDFYQWSTGDTTISIAVSQTGVYTCIATKDCTNDSTSITIVERPCCGSIGSSQSVSICGNNSYLFNGQSLTQSGVYRDTLQTSQGCDSIVVLTLTVNLPLQSTISETICSGASYSFNGLNLTQSGVYRDTLQNAQGCDSIVALTLTVNPPLGSNFSQSICAGNSYLFKGEQLTQSGVFEDTLQSAIGGCDSIVSLTLTVLPLLQSNISQTICEGDFYLFNGTLLSESGEYHDTMQNCEVITLTLSVIPIPELVSSENNFEIDYGESVTLRACAIGETYRWVGANCENCESITVTPSRPLLNYLCIVSNDVCSDTCVFTIKTNGIFGTIYVPNAFSPNGDNGNDLFQIFGNNIRLVRLQIFNRWGEKVFDTPDIGKGWDGKYKGVPQPAGIYTYALTYFSGVEDKARDLKGSITLMR